MSTVSAVIPVKDGSRYLAEVLDAVSREGVDEALVIDSGSRDRSVQIARAAGAVVIEIEPHAFGHGRTRNLGAEESKGDLICFLTQDATPLPGWLDAYREAFALATDVGAAYGPHIPRSGASPMIARELTHFFATFSPAGTPVVQRDGDPTFLSNVNACYSRACWEEVRFRDVAYAEDQAFGADLLAAGWSKVYHPRAAVLHSHDYGLVEFMRRYFDEYRGLRESIGHVEPIDARTAIGHVRRSVLNDMHWLKESGASNSQAIRWVPRSALHHGGRRVFSVLGSRAERLPGPLQRNLSLERRSGAAAHPPEAAIPTDRRIRAPSVRVEPGVDREFYEFVAEVWRHGVTPLLDPVPGSSERSRLRLAMIVPPFTRGSGGHTLLFQILMRLEQRGHVCSVWIHDTARMWKDVRPAVVRGSIREFFAPIAGPVFSDFADWGGADVVLATGWDTVYRALRLGHCRARVYLVNDHEPEFFATSAESELARETYGYGLHCLAGSPWLRDLLAERYGATGDVVNYGVDHEVYQPRPIPRRADTVIYYARDVTPRRAVPIGILALAELHRRRPGVRIVLFGTDRPIHTSFPYEYMGILSPEELSWLYSEATVGLSLSLTNFSLIPKEMLACGLPCVELAGVSAESVVGRDGPTELAPLNSIAIADALERLLDSPALRDRRSRDGLAFTEAHTWDRAADEVEAGIRHALALRERPATRSV